MLEYFLKFLKHGIPLKRKLYDAGRPLPLDDVAAYRAGMDKKLEKLRQDCFSGNGPPRYRSWREYDLFSPGKGVDYKRDFNMGFVSWSSFPAVNLPIEHQIESI
jgi:hypothetical protein